MKNLKITVLSCFISVVFLFSPVAQADWVWSPDKGKFVNTDEGGQDDAQDTFDLALDLFKEKKLDKSAEQFQLILKKFPKSRVAPEAAYRLGTIYEEKGDLVKAHNSYKSIIKNYTQSQRFDEVIEREYQIGNAFLSGKKGKIAGLAIRPSLPLAIESFQLIVESAPFGTFGDLAQYQIGVAQYKSGHYDDAVESFQELVDRYPQSKLVKDARLQIAEAAYAKASFETRDQSALEAASKQAARYLKRYPESEHAAKAAKIRQEVDERNAKKNYRIGLYYEKDNYLESALIYYRDTARRYPHTAWGKKAEDKLNSLEQPVTYLTAKEGEVQVELQKLEAQLQSLDKSDKVGRSELKEKIKVLKKKLHEINKSKGDSLNRRKKDLKRREKELDKKFKEFEKKKKRYKDNKSPEFAKAMARWQSSLEAERDAIEEEKARLANWREELGVTSEPFYQNMLDLIQPDTPLEKVRKFGEKDLYKLSRKKKDLLEKKEKFYKRYSILQKDLAPQFSESGVEIKRLRGAERKIIAAKSPEQLTSREKEIQRIEKELDTRLALYEKHYGKMAEQELESIMAKKIAGANAGVSPFDASSGELQSKSLNDLLALKMHLEEKLVNQQTIVDTLSNAFNREMVLQEQKAVLDSLDERKETDFRKLRKQIKAVEKDIRKRYQDIEDRHKKTTKLLEELDRNLSGDQGGVLKTVAKPVTGTVYLAKSFLFGLPNQDETLTQEAREKGNARALELEQQIELESLMIETQNLETTKLEKKREILNAKASLAGGYKVRSSYVKVPYIFINEAIESARRVVPKKTRRQVLLNRLDKQSRELDSVKKRLAKVDASIQAQSATTPTLPSTEATTETKTSEQAPDEKQLRDEIMQLFEELEISYSIYAREEGLLSDEYRARLEQEMEAPGADKERAKQYKELKKVEASLCKLIDKELKIEQDERVVLEKRSQEVDRLLPEVTSKAMKQDMITEKDRAQQRLKNLEIRRDFLVTEKARFNQA